MRELVGAWTLILLLAASAGAQQKIPARPEGLHGPTPPPGCNAAELRIAWSEWKRVRAIAPANKADASDPAYANRRAALARYDAAYKLCTPQNGG